MTKYVKFIVLGAFFAPNPMYWIVLASCALLILISIYARDNIDLNDCMTAEQPYQITLGFVVENHIAIPKQVYYTENGKRIMIPTRDTSIIQRDGDIYDAYSRIRRKDGTGYDYVASVVKRTSETEFKEIRTSCGREIGT